MTTKIEWAEESWNPVTGCTPISEGCQNCYAKRMARTLAGRYGYPESPNEFDVTLHEDRLAQPYYWKKPRRVFLCSMGDLFHEEVPFAFVDRVFTEMRMSNWHTCMVLTKRPERAIEYFDYDLKRRGARLWTPPHIWIGVTAENEKRADERIPILLQIPAAVRFVSIEPMLEPIGLSEYLSPQRYEDLDRPMLDWVIVGGETGPGARPMQADWARSVRDQCRAAGVPFFMKQMAKKAPIPEDLMIREYPAAARNGG